MKCAVILNSNTSANLIEADSIGEAIIGAIKESLHHGIDVVKAEAYPLI